MPLTAFRDLSWDDVLTYEDVVYTVPEDPTAMPPSELTPEGEAAALAWLAQPK